MSQKGGFKVKIGFVPSHRSIFDENWAINMRKRCLEVFSSIEGLEIIVPDEKVTRNGLVSSEEDADKTICLFREKEIDGVIIGTMTFHPLKSQVLLPINQSYYSAPKNPHSHLREKDYQTPSAEPSQFPPGSTVGKSPSYLLE